MRTKARFGTRSNWSGGRTTVTVASSLAGVSKSVTPTEPARSGAGTKPPPRASSSPCIRPSASAGTGAGTTASPAPSPPVVGISPPSSRPRCAPITSTSAPFAPTLPRFHAPRPTAHGPRPTPSARLALGQIAVRLVLSGVGRPHQPEHRLGAEGVAGDGVGQVDQQREAAVPPQRP